MATQKIKKSNIDKISDFLSCRPLPVAANATSAFASHTDSEFIYYMNGANFYHYNAYVDSWEQLASPLNAGTTLVAMSAHPKMGYYSTVIESTSNQVKLAGLDGYSLIGKKIRIVSGKGAGQTRTITAATEPIIISKMTNVNYTFFDLGSNTSANLMQWVTEKGGYTGYQIRIFYNTLAQSYVRPVFSRTKSYREFVVNSNAWPGETPWRGAAAPSLPGQGNVATSSQFTIEYNLITVDSNWNIIPDSSSGFIIESEGVMLITSNASAPFYVRQYYTVLGNFWYQMEWIPGRFTAALGTDVSITNITPLESPTLSGTLTSASNKILQDSSLNLDINKYLNYRIKIIAGTGAGQEGVIIGNSNNKFYLQNKLSITPDSTSTYSISLDDQKLFLHGNGTSSFFEADFDSQFLGQNPLVDWGHSISTAIVGDYGNYAQASSGGVGTASSSISTFSISNPGAGYHAGDFLTVLGGVNSIFRITTVGNSGEVLSIKMMYPGVNITGGIGIKSTTVGGVLSSNGTGCTIEILSVTSNGLTITLDTTAPNTLDLDITKKYTLVNSSGASISDVSIYINSQFGTTVITDKGAGSFTNGTAASSTSIFDITKNWDTNEHTGRLLFVRPVNSQSSTFLGLITSNTSKSLTFSGGGTVTSDTKAKYFITEKWAYASLNALVSDQSSGAYGTGTYGVATDGSNTTLIDTSKNWPINHWARTNSSGGTTSARKIRIISGTGAGNEILIVSNTSNTLTFASQSFSIDNTSIYIIMENFGIATAGSTTTMSDNSQCWPVSYLKGYRVKFLYGTSAGNEYTITDNTTSTVTFATGTAPDTTTGYVILAPANRGSGVGSIHTYGSSNTELRKYIYLFRGGATPEIGRYDLTTKTYNTVFNTSYPESFSTGSMYAYDGQDAIYITKDATGKIFKYNILTNIITNIGVVPYGMSTATIGNRMAVKYAEDGTKYLFIARHSGQEMWRLKLS
jgi:hypothetical protein